MSKLFPVIQKIISWEKPLVTISVLAMMVLTIYRLDLYTAFNFNIHFTLGNDQGT